MSDWNHLPTDILRTIFQHFEINRWLKPLESNIPRKYALIPTNDLLQCQYICKNWAALAKTMWYKTIILKDLFQLVKFTNTLLLNNGLAPFVEHIYISFGLYVDKVLSNQISKIGYLCINLKTLLNASYSATIKWSKPPNLSGTRVTNSTWWRWFITGKRYGYFSNLEVIPFKHDPNSLPEILNYNKATFPLRHTLRELAIYSKIPKEERNFIQDYPNVNFVHYVIFDDYMNVIDQEIKGYSSVNSLAIYATRYRSLVGEDMSIINTCQHVKNLYIPGDTYENSFYRYLMKAFPKLDTICLGPETNNDIRLTGLPSDLQTQFTQYLVNIPDVYPRSIIARNVNEVLAELHKTRNDIRCLELDDGVYFSSFGPYLGDSPYDVTINRNVCYKVIIHFNSPEHVQLALHNFGMIKKSGESLISLKIDSKIPVYLYEIFLSCPNLKNISIRNTRSLIPFGSHPVLEPRAVYESLEIVNVSLDSHFFSQLSSSVSFIKNFTIQLCEISGSTNDYVTIDMLDTKFYSIVLKILGEFDAIYLKLDRIAAGISLIGYYVMREGCDHQQCTEDEFLDSTQDYENFSLFIRCEDIKKIIIKTGYERCMSINV